MSRCLRTHIMSSALIATVLLAGLVIVPTLPATPASVADAQNALEFDMVLANGRVMDPESNLDAIRHVGIRTGKIAAVSSRPLRGRTLVDAKGLVVAPGFIDLQQRHKSASGNRSSVN